MLHHRSRGAGEAPWFRTVPASGPASHNTSSGFCSVQCPPRVWRITRRVSPHEEHQRSCSSILLSFSTHWLGQVAQVEPPADDELAFAEDLRLSSPGLPVKAKLATPGRVIVPEAPEYRAFSAGG